MYKLFCILTAIFFMYLFYIIFPLNILLLGLHKQAQILSPLQFLLFDDNFSHYNKMCYFFNINSIPSIMNFFGNLDGESLDIF